METIFINITTEKICQAFSKQLINDDRVISILFGYE